jgi:hypothetical protein
MDEKTIRSYVRLVLERAVGGPGMTGKQFLQMIDDGPYHSMPVAELTPEEVEAAEKLVMRNLLRRMPANGRMPERFVLTSSGSHGTDTFAGDTLRDETPGIRSARRAGTLKTKKW